MRRVAYLFPQGDLGGAEIATARMAEAHDRQRYVPVALLLTDGPLAERLRGADIAVRIAPSRPRLADHRQRRQVRDWIATQLRGDATRLLHSVMAWAHALAAPCAKVSGARAIWFQHNRPSLTSLIDWWASLNTASLIITNSRFTARLQRRLNVARRRMEVVYPPVVLPHGGYDVTAIRAAWEFTDSDLIALVPARLQRWKGQDIAIRSLAAATRQVPQLQLLLAGGALFGLEHDYRTELEQLAIRLGVSERLRFAGHQEDMGGLYRASDMVLHTSREPEPYGLSVAEARAHGCAIVASDAGAIREQIVHGRNGLLVKPGDPGALSQAMIRLANQPELRRKLGEAAASDTVVTPSAAARQLERLYDQVLEQ